MTTTRLLRLLAAVVILAAALMPVPAAAASNVTEVASGLDSPRGVALYHGLLLVGEAGHGSASGGPACFTPPNGPGEICVGFTSQISLVAGGHHWPLVSDLFSISLGREGVLGVSGLSVGEDGKILGIMGLTPQELDAGPCNSSSNPAACRQIIAKAKDQAGHLISVAPGQWHSVASVGEPDYKFTEELAKTDPNVEIDANPYGVLADEEGVLVADAGSNTLDRVNEQGKISILQYFKRFDPKTFPSDAVPTCVARTGGSLWVADLSGRLFRLSEDGTGAQHEVAVKDSHGASLLQHVTGCASDEDGNLYLVNMWGTPGLPTPGTGSVVRFPTGGGPAEVVAPGLNFPNMIAVAEGGTLYVSTNSVCPAAAVNVTKGPCAGGGKVVRISHSEEAEG